MSYHEAYLQHGRGTSGPFSTERVEFREKLLWWQEDGLSYTASGYGRRIPSPYQVRYQGRWRRVYICQISNAGTAFIGKDLASGIVVEFY